MSHWIPLFLDLLEFLITLWINTLYAATAWSFQALSDLGFVVLSVVDCLCFLIPSEIPQKIVTGTIALQVGDINDNCPTLTNRVEYICSDTEVFNIIAEDEDGDPNSAPFTFSLVAEESTGEWKVEPLNGMDTLYFYIISSLCEHYFVIKNFRINSGNKSPFPCCCSTTHKLYGGLGSRWRND